MERFSPRQKLTHTDALWGADPHLDPHAEIRGKSTGEEVRFPLRCFYHFRRLHHLCHEATHGLCGFVLLLAGGVGVGAESETRIVVSQHAADGFDIHAILQCQRCEGMSEINSHFPIDNISLRCQIYFNLFLTVYP